MSGAAGASEEVVDGVPVRARERHAELSRTLEEHAFRYYVLDAPSVADAEYDALLRELRDRTKAPAPHLAQFKQGLFAKMRDRLRL